jgi:hypothetical protein
MKSNPFTCLIILFLTATFTVQAAAQQNAGFKEPALSAPGSWSLILLPDGKTIKVMTFSPLFAISPTTRQFAWRTEAYDEVTIILD